MTAGVTAGEVGGDCGRGGGCGSGGFGGLSAVAAIDAGFAGKTAGPSIGSAAWVSPRDTERATTVGFSATAGGDDFSASGADIGLPATGFGGEL